MVRPALASRSGAPAAARGRAPGRAAALALVLALLAAGRARADAVPRVASIELRVPAGEDRAQLAGLVALAPGDPLSARALRRTVQRLYQAGRFRNVVVRAVPAGPDAVALVVEALPIRVLASLDVRADAAAGDPAALRSATRLAIGESFDEPDVAAAAQRVKALLARRGYRDAAVDARVLGEDAISIHVQAGAPVRIRSIRIAGKGEAPPLTDRLTSRAGAVLDEDVLDADARTLRAALDAAGYRRARVGAPAIRIAGGEADVEIPVDAGPRLAFLFRGSEAVPPDVLARQLGLEPGQPADGPALAAAADRIRAFYRARGYADARVDVEEVRRGRTVFVVFHVDEGRSYRLADVRLDGVAQREPAAVRARLAALLDGEGEGATDGGEADRARELMLSVPTVKPPRAAPGPLAPSAAWDEVAWERAAEQLVDDYRADGWLEAVYLGSSVSLDTQSRTASVALRFREGPRTLVESIAFEGNRAISPPELARESRLTPGEPLAFERVEQTRAAILHRYITRGYLYVRVEARDEIERERHSAVVHFVVQEGPQVRIGRILVSGNRRTQDDVVRDALAIQEGEVYDPEAMARSQTALLGLGVFRSVALRLQEPEAPQETKDVVVEVSERPYATLAQGVGFSIADGPRAFLEYGRPNLFGRALELSARAKVNYLVPTKWREVPQNEADRVEGRADVGLRTARLSSLSFPTTARADMIGEILHRTAYDLRRASGITGVDVNLTSRISASLQYELEVDRIERTGAVGILTQADMERLRFADGVTTLQAIRPTIALDYRDNSAHPHRGWYASTSLEYERSLGTPTQGALFGVFPGSDIHSNLLKLSSTASAYVPVAGGTVVALSLRGGKVFPLDDRSQTIIPRRFFLGGASTMRGYGEEEMIPQDVRADLAAEARYCATSPAGIGCTERGRRIQQGEQPVSEGGEAFLLAKAELRIPVKGSLEAGLFFDLGNLWLDPSKVRFVDLRPNAGVGIRFVTPIGPAALDLGFNLSPDRAINEITFAPHFTIGLF
jgi:outer membrane protein assembly complex protein YaeT